MPLDPPDDAMTAAEFRALREHLGLTGDALAGLLGGRDPRTVRSWEQGRYPIPAGVRDDLHALARETADHVARTVAQLAACEPRVLVTYRNDEEYRAADPGGKWPASWHRAVAARVRDQLPDLRLTYAD